MIARKRYDATDTPLLAFELIPLCNDWFLITFDILLMFSTVSEWLLFAVRGGRGFVN